VPLTRLTRPRVAGLLMASAALAVSVAACSGGASDSPAAANGNQGGGPGGNAAFTAYVQCLQKNGVTITLPSGGPRGAGRPSGYARPSGGARPSGFPRPSGSAGARFPGGGMGGFFQKPADVSQDTWDKAQSACASVRPSLGAGRGGRGNGGGADAAYRNCLRQHGVTQGTSSTDPAVKKAEQTCAVLKPTASPTPSA
jgi:hypothetical protein